jgi:hypothetical protein
MKMRVDSSTFRNTSPCHADEMLSLFVHKMTGYGSHIRGIAVPAISFTLSLNPEDFFFQKFTEFPSLFGQMNLLVLQLFQFIAQLAIFRARSNETFHERLAFSGQGIGSNNILFPQAAKFPFSKIKGLPEKIIRTGHYVSSVPQTM